MVISPATYLTPGTVTVTAAPNLGLAEIGGYPSGADELSEAIAATLTAAGWASRALVDVMSWKHAKLLDNLSNAAQVVVSIDARGGEVASLARQERTEVLAGAGIPYVSLGEVVRIAGELGRAAPVNGLLQRLSGGFPRTAGGRPLTEAEFFEALAAD